ncbi:FxLYD domain-containing protein [Streptomyces subrutilus]|uniref:FxLYD domain-containing protein n=1 Tax=Streptomyces subrutilus TaxID=36818 RepID=UPI002E0E4DC5|nr:FxLYD domain-containing protein [Streptomyces subrutilus]
MSQQPPYGQTPPPGYGYPPPPPAPKKSSAGKIIGFGCLGVVGLVVLLGVVGAMLGTDGKDKTATPPAPGASAAPSAPAKAPASEPAAPAPKGAEADVKITSCEVDSATNWAKANLTITNGSSKKSNYLINVEFVNASGTRVGEAIAATNNLAPGQAAQQTAQGLDQIKDKVTCKVTSVTRYAS